MNCTVRKCSRSISVWVASHLTLALVASRLFINIVYLGILEWGDHISIACAFWKFASAEHLPHVTLLSHSFSRTTTEASSVCSCLQYGSRIFADVNQRSLAD